MRPASTPVADGRRLAAVLAVSVVLHAVALAWVKSPLRPAPPPSLSVLIASLRLAVPAATQEHAVARMVATPPQTEVRRTKARREARVQDAAPVSAGPTMAPRAPAVTDAVARPVDEAPVAATALPSSAGASVTSPAPAASAVPHSAVAEGVAGDPPGEALDDYGRDLAALFSRRQQYPRLAALRGWEGEVRVRLAVARRGDLIRVRLERSSGHEVLDRHALAMIEEIGRLPSPPAGLLSAAGELQVVVPVHYRLQRHS